MPDHLSALGVPIAVLTMFLAQRMELRLGAAAAGWFAALPIAFAVAVATISVTQSPADASLVALSAAGHAGPMTAYAVAFVGVTTRVGAVRGFPLAALVYAAASVAVIPVPGPLRIAGGVIGMTLGAVFMARQPRSGHPGQAATTTQQVLSLSSAAVVVAVITLVNERSGPDLAGTIGAFPTMSTTIALFLAHRSGVGHGNSVMGGMVKSLPIYVGYCLAFAFLVTRTMTAGAVVGATCLALLVAVLTWRTVDRARPVQNGALLAEHRVAEPAG